MNFKTNIQNAKSVVENYGIKDCQKNIIVL